MLKKKIETANAPSAIGSYSQAIVAGKTVYLSGQIPLVPATMQLISDDIHSQVKQVFENLRAVCIAAGGDLNAIVKLTVYLIDFAHFPVVNDIMTTFFAEPYPARATLQVSRLPRDAKIEVEAVMVVS